MPQLENSPAIADALLSACEPLFALIDADPALLPVASALITALLHEAQSKQLCGPLFIRRIQARLAVAHRIVAGLAQPTSRGPGLG
jgi:hypothetical protein